jgi:hypothetical protein
MFSMVRRLPRRGQSMVEFSLVAPVLVMMLFLMIDFGRLVYTYSAMSFATREGARLLSLPSQQQSDCAALQKVEEVGRGFPITPDPNSTVGDTDPAISAGGKAPTPPPAGQGYVYIWPAVAPSTPQDTNCNGLPRQLSPNIREVAVQCEYTWLPLMPLVSSIMPPIRIRTLSVVQTEY